MVELIGFTGVQVSTGVYKFVMSSHVKVIMTLIGSCYCALGESGAGRQVNNKVGTGEQEGWNR